MLFASFDFEIKFSSFLLEKFLKLEEEKKEKRRVKKVDKGPQITFKSYSCKDDASMEPKSFVALSAIEVNDLHNPLRLEQLKQTQMSLVFSLMEFWWVNMAL